MRKLLFASLAALALVAGLVVAGPAVAADSGTWTGEVVDIACYVPKGAKGAAHADCAKTCVKSGQPMGLLTADGDLVLLAADHGDAKPFEALKDLAGQQAKVTGSLAENGGMKVITVTGAEPAG